MLPTILSTKFGQVQGIMDEDVLRFKSVPYAAPPVGELRWCPPVDPAPWDGVLDCTQSPCRAMQNLQGGDGFEPWLTDFYGETGFPERSEDCLYLDIATTAEPGEKRPVYMWFHGGGLANGHISEMEFNPTVLAKKGIVVVLVAQRLNIFGYLALPQLSAEQNGLSGNYGLMDEVKALDWVRENITAFGGDPDQITIGGQSGGCWKAGALAACPAARGKIRRVINQSSLCWNQKFAPLAVGEQLWGDYLEEIGLDRNISMEELRKVDPEVFYKEGLRAPATMFCDGKLVPNEDMTVSFAEYAGDLDYLAGGNFGECVMTREFGLGGPITKTAAEFYQDARAFLGDELYEKYDFENLFPVEDEKANRLSRHLAVEGLTLNGGEIKNRYFGAYRAKKWPEAKTFTYIFSRVTPHDPADTNPVRDPEKLLAWHSSELYYTFYSLRPGKPAIRPWTEYDFQLADQMSSYWANFIKTGNPNGEGLPYWPESGENWGYVELGDEITAYEGTDSEKDQLLLDYLKENFDLPQA